MNQTQPPLTSDPAENWAGEMGARWLAHIETFEGMIAPIGAALMDRASLTAGQRVLDVGCGGGVTTMAVGPRGSALGLDISPGLIARARQRAETAGVSNVSFRCADAAERQPEGPVFERVISRFGSMFFAEPYAAFGNLHDTIRPGGRLDLAVWAAPRENLWMSAMVAVVRDHIDLPRPQPRAPGPFAFEDPDYLRDVLETSGFRDIAFEAWSADVPFAGPGAACADAVAFALDGMAFRDKVAALTARERAKLSQALGAFYEGCATPDGIRMPAKAWLVQAAV
ncbi:MAG: hypothetical protein B7Z42_08405 [Brevundimonas sp. 12-68-7]|uniref:Methyltransferase domain-containing protein n=1 Tax=Brevundimonas subvibrioides TaxID=74313 RepID=A0A258FKF8_9CAUL|nr:MAG: hypothetical protein B7Z42_08405 [Brevundimonas sp. 12-68-7]OYX32619.1 MAG: hypothetical protein B7Z01_10670 [Brevundimonas subvibrioides]